MLFATSSIRNPLLLAVLVTTLLGHVHFAVAQPFSSGTSIVNKTSGFGSDDLHVVDIDGDGDKDVLSASSSFDEETELFRNGDTSGGGDGSSWTESVVNSSGATSVHAADIDGDGDQDVLSSSYGNGTVSLHRNGDATGGGGDGTSWTTLNITTSADEVESVYAVDIDGDGDQDVLAGGTVYRNGDVNGGGDGSSWTAIEVSSSSAPSQAADIDGDGDQDVLVGGNLYRNGDTGGGGDGSSWTKIEVSSLGVSCVHLADIDGDGDQDVLIGSGSAVAFYRNGNTSGGGDGSSWSKTTITTSADGVESVHASNVDGDGDQDVLSASFSDDTIALYLNEGGTGSSWTTNAITASENGAGGVSAADIDGDGRKDVMSAALNEDEALKWYRQLPVVYVDVDASSGAENGSSWADAYVNLQDALTSLPSGEIEIWVASGTYYPDEGNGQTQDDRSSSFTIPDQASLYGGFGGTDGAGGGAQEAVRGQRNPDPKTNGTVLSGDLGTADLSDDNAYHVVTVPNNAVVEIDGFTIRDGESENSGAGILANSGSELHLKKSRIIDNSASANQGNGGGIYSEGTLNLSNVTLANNSAKGQGGAIYGSGTFSNITVRNNSAELSGGGIAGSGKFTDFEIKNNTSKSGGGGIFLRSDATLKRGTFVGNEAASGGGGLSQPTLSPNADLYDITFINNDGGSGRGGGAFLLTSRLNAVDVEFYGNSAKNGGGLMLVGKSLLISNAVFSGNTATSNGGAIATEDSNPDIVNTSISRNHAKNEGGGVYIDVNRSPKIKNTILWGNTSISSGGEQQLFLASGDSPTVENSLIQGGIPQGAVDNGGNLAQDPQFVDADGPDGTVGTKDDDLRLHGPGYSEPSPAIDAGDSGLLPEDVFDVDGDGNTSESLPLDLSGNTRERDVSGISGSGVDMGAYESRGNALPVELAAFDVQQQSGAAILTWQTASEHNNAGFEIQRRRSTDWQSLTFIEGAGTTSESQQYRFRDADLPYEADSVTYRLKQVDTDGTTAFSDQRTLRIGAPDQLSLHAPFPNPAQGQVTLRYALPRKTDVSIRVYDVLGRRVATLQRGTQDAGRNEIQISTSDLSSGTYFVRMQAGEKLKTKQLTVVK